MSFLDSIFDFVDDVAGAAGCLGYVAIDTVGELASSAVDTVQKHPGKVALVCVGTIASAGAAAAFAGPIATACGSVGLLGTTASGTTISTLSGAALSNASLAAFGGGAIATGGGGMAAGVTAIGASGASLGAAVSTGAAVGVVRSDKNGEA